MEPRYYWANEQLEKVFWLRWKPLFVPEVMVLSGPVDVLSQLAGPLKKQLTEQPLGILRDIMDSFPQELVVAMVGVFPRGNPSTDSWQQEDLWRSVQLKHRVVTTQL
jgi:hypothetical protein